MTDDLSREEEKNATVELSIQDQLAAEQLRQLKEPRRKDSILRHPLSLTAIGFLLTGLLGQFLSSSYQTETRERERQEATREARLQAIGTAIDSVANMTEDVNAAFLKVARARAQSEGVGMSYDSARVDLVHTMELIARRRAKTAYILCNASGPDVSSSFVGLMMYADAFSRSTSSMLVSTEELLRTMSEWDRKIDVFAKLADSSAKAASRQRLDYESRFIRYTWGCLGLRKTIDSMQ